MISVRDPVERVVLVAAPRKGSKDGKHIDEHLEELTRLVTASNEVFDAFASEDLNISRAVSKLPSTLPSL